MEQTANAVSVTANATETNTSNQTVETGSVPANETVGANETKSSETTANETGSAPETQKTESQEKLLRRRAQEAEQEAEYWRGVAAGRTQPADQEPPAHETTPQGPPQIEQFDNYDDFLVAKAKYEVRQEDAKTKTEQSRKDALQNYNDRFTKAVEKLPDLPKIADRLLRDPRLPQNPAVVEAVISSEVGPEIVHYLGTNINEAIRIGRLPYAAAAREIGKIESKISASAAQPQNRISQAPEPVKPVTPKGSALNNDYDKMSVEDFMRKRNEEEAARR